MLLRLGTVLLAGIVILSMLEPPVGEVHGQLQEMIPESYRSDPLSTEDHRKISNLAGSVSAVDWLGPLAPIAISPFFGLACLCGISQYGQDWLPANEFVSNNPVLQNPVVLWSFFFLTLVTSLPRLTKVSKPVGQAIDQLEAWSGIITVIVIRVAAAGWEPSNEGETALVAAVPVYQCGLFSMSADAFFSIAAIINIVVINTVKFFFEVSVWLVPFPFVDAMLEVANKSVCATLMAIYAWSPFWATVLNLVLFVACLLVFRWIKRRVIWLRSLVFDPLWSYVQPSYGVPAGKQLTVFTMDSLGPFAARERIQLINEGDAWRLTQPRWLMATKTLELPKSECSMSVHCGLLTNRIQIQGTTEAGLLFTRRFNTQLDQLGTMMDLKIVENNACSEATPHVPAF